MQKAAYGIDLAEWYSDGFGRLEKGCFTAGAGTRAPVLGWSGFEEFAHGLT